MPANGIARARSAAIASTIPPVLRSKAWLFDVARRSIPSSRRQSRIAGSAVWRVSASRVGAPALGPRIATSRSEKTTSALRSRAETAARPGQSCAQRSCLTSDWPSRVTRVVLPPRAIGVAHPARRARPEPSSMRRVSAGAIAPAYAVRGGLAQPMRKPHRRMQVAATEVSRNRASGGHAPPSKKGAIRGCASGRKRKPQRRRTAATGASSADCFSGPPGRSVRLRPFPRRAG